MRRPVAAANWKLHLGPRAASALAADLATRLDGVDGVDVVVFPTAVSATAVIDALRGTAIGVGLQWTAPQASGAHTGTNSPALAREIGCGWALAGHSEVRRDLGESDARVGASATAALSAGLLPLVCVGETLEERDAGRLVEVVERQLQAALGHLPADQAATCTLAYEPVWAIGTGRTASPEQAQEAHAAVRAWLSVRFPPFVARDVRVLYGGSVKPDNAAALLAAPDVDGVLVGGASLDATAFAAITRAVAAARA